MRAPRSCCCRTPSSWRNAWKPQEFAVICTCGTDKFTTSRWRPTSCPKGGGQFDTSGISSKRSPLDLTTAGKAWLGAVTRPSPWQWDNEHRESVCTADLFENHGINGSRNLIGRHSCCSRSSSGSIGTVSRCSCQSEAVVSSGHATFVVFVGQRVGTRALSLDGIGDWHVVGEHTVALVHERRVTRCCAVKTGSTVERGVRGRDAGRSVNSAR